MTIALRFTEWMDGFAALGQTDPTAGNTAATKKTLSMQLMLATDDLDAFIRSPERLLQVQGELSYEPFGDHVPVRGTVNQLIDVGDDPRHKTMPYELDLELLDDSGRARTIKAVKHVNPPLRNAWKDTTTLDVLILEDSGRVIGAGIVYIRFFGFLRQFVTYRCSGGTWIRRVVAPPRFYAAFLEKLWEVYGFRLRGRT